MSKSKMIVRTKFIDRACHWTVVICFFLVALSGISFFFPTLQWLTQAHDRPEHHLLPGVVLTDIRHFMLIAFQYFDNVQQPRNIFLIRDVVMHKTHKHKHQCDENRNADRKPG